MSDEINKENTQAENQEGAFVASLKRNNKTIKADRAEAIVEDGEVVYKRMVEDLGRELNKMKRQRNNMLDLAPNNTTSTITKDFDPDIFVDEDMELSIKIYNTEIKLKVAQERYNFLFQGGV